MAPVPITGEIRTGRGQKDSRPWRAWSPVIREGVGGEVITTLGKELPVYVVAGQFAAQLEPGVCVIEDPDGKRYTVTVPDEPADLWELIATAVAFPPDTSAEALASAVTGYLEENPPVADWTALANKPAAIAAGADQAAARAAVGAYAKPGSGIPKADLVSAVQTSLDKADSAYQAPSVVAAGPTQAAARAAIGALDSTATSTLISAAVSNLLNGAPGALDTLKELADALGDDANFATSVTAALTAKAPLASPTFSGTMTAGRVQLGAGTASAAKPYNALYSIPASAIPASGNVIGHSRITVFGGDWTVKATVTINGTGGTAAWTIGGQTANIAPTASAATVQTALTALTSVGAGNITVTGGPGGSSPVPYVVTYSPAFIAKNRYLELTIDATNLTGGTQSRTITWNGTWGVDTGFLWGENSYTVTGTDPVDGNGIAVLFGGLFEADQRSNGTIGLMVGLAAEASFTLASAGGFVDTVIGMMVSRSQHKDNALQYQGTAREVYGIQVGGVQNSRTFADGVTSSTTNPTVITSATAQFSVTDVSKVVTGAGIPANTYIVSATSTAATLSNPCTATATGVAVTILGTHQCTTAYTAWFGPGTVQANGALKVNGWKDEAQLVVTGWNNQTSNLAEWWFNTNRVARIATTGGLTLAAGLGLFEGNPNAASIGVNSALVKPALSFGFPLDVALTRDAAGVLGVAGGLRLGAGYATVAGSRLWSGSGAPSIATSVAGDFYFRTDTPTVANQRVYVATAGNTWMGIL